MTSAVVINVYFQLVNAEKFLWAIVLGYFRICGLQVKRKDYPFACHVNIHNWATYNHRFNASLFFIFFSHTATSLKAWESFNVCALLITGFAKTRNCQGKEYDLLYSLFSPVLQHCASFTLLHFTAKANYS